MDYYNKYLKYKTKYLNLLKGGTVPQIDCDLLPFENTNINIIYQGRYILKNNDDTNNNYLLNSQYQFEKTQNQINQLLFQTSDLSFLANLNIKLGDDLIPFHVSSLQFNFNIIIGIINYINYFDDNILTIKDGLIKDAINSFRSYIIQKIFHIDRETYIFLGISNHNSILNCFSFFNKLHEFLNYILLNEYNPQTFNKLFPNLENIKDFYNIYSYFYKIQNKEATIKTYLQSSSNIFYDDIKKFKNFIKNCNKIDNHIKFKSMFGISLINLILINWIYLRILRTNLVIGSLSSNLYPINRLNFLENIFQMNEEKIYCYARKQKELNKEKDINNLLLEKIGVPIIPYGQSIFKDQSFPNCVENTMLQLLKILAWDDNKYNINLLPEGISEDFKDIIERIDKEPLKIESKEIMDDFVLLVSNVEKTNDKLKLIKYQIDKEYNIESNIENVGNILNYIFNGNTVSGGISNYNDRIFKKINFSTDEYKLEQKGNIIIIDKNSFKINIIIENGHTSIDNKISSIYKLINCYKYLNILYTFNYTKDDSINFSLNFINFCKKQNQVIKDYLTNKIINIQNINLQIKNSKDEAGNTCLHIAIYVDNLLKVREFINKNIVDIDIKNNLYYTPLTFASKLGKCECVKFLIEIGADINITSKGYSALEIASINGHIECIKILIEKSEKIIPNKNYKEKSLINVSIYGKFECLKWLIDNDADINYVSEDDGNTPLLWASTNGHIECVKLLIEKGANVNYSNYGTTALDYASSYGHIECVKYLVEKGANINHVNNAGDTALILASYNGNIECVEYLFEKGSKIDHANKTGCTSLIYASWNGYIECVKFLIKNGANINHARNNGDTSLIIAINFGRIECVKLLIEKCANVNHANDYGDTSIINASSKGDIECIKLLIEKGANVNHVNNSGFSALIYASKRGHTECVNFLIQNGARQ
jgi:ankyrin repeat protein